MFWHAICLSGCLTGVLPMSFSNNQSERNHPRIRAGRAGDPFGIELDVLHALAYPLQDGTTPNLGDYSGPGQGSLIANLPKDEPLVR